CTSFLVHPTPTLSPYTTLFRSHHHHGGHGERDHDRGQHQRLRQRVGVVPGGGGHGPAQHRRLAHQQPAGGEDQQVGGVGEQGQRSEEHTSELQSRENLVCRLLL